MTSTKNRTLVALSIAATFALPSTALAQHGADDSAAPTGEHVGQLESTGGADDHQQDSHQQGTVDQHDAQPAQPQRVETYNLRGSVVSVDPTTDTVVVQVKQANHGRRGRALSGQSVTVDLTGARVRVADANGDGTRDINDVAAGDRVEVRVRLPRSQPADLSQPVAAQRFVDRAEHASDDPANHS
jgi:hypothetical protein